MSAQNKINGVQLFWELHGNTGEPLVLVHGSWVDHHKWDMVVPELSKSFRVLTYDRRGHSRSERPATPDSIHDDVADLAALIEALDLAPAHIMGSSFGGSIALRLAGVRPDLFRSLIVNEPPLLGLLADDADSQMMIEAIKDHFGEIERLLESGDMEDGVRHFVEAVAFGPGAWAHIPPQLKKTVIFNAPTFLNELRDADAFSLDFTRLRSFTHPILLTFGDQSPPFLTAIVKKLANILPQAEQKLFLGAGHEPDQSHPEAFVAALSDFIVRATHSHQDVSA